MHPKSGLGGQFSRRIDGGALRRIIQERYLRLLDSMILPTRPNELSKLLPAQSMGTIRSPTRLCFSTL